MRKRAAASLILLALMLAWIISAHAHQGALGFWLLRVEDETVRSLISIDILDLNFIPQLDTNQDGFLEHREILERRELVESRILEHFAIRNNGQMGGARISNFQVLPTGQLSIESEHRFEEPLKAIELQSTFHELTAYDHRVFCSLEYEGETQEYFFDLQHPRREVDLTSAGAGTVQQMGRFLLLGVEHIFTGYDHVAFLIGLLILGGTLRSLIGIVSSFTIAHSITLSLATLGVIALPTRFVESAIAVSICYIALENIILPETDGRWKITFFFGLIHGFGFSNILREMNLPRSALFTSLFSFNFGVEVGQVMIIAFLFPLIFYIARQSWHRAAVTAVSSLIAVLGLIWFIERMS